MTETEVKVQDLIRQFEDAARVVTSLNPDERKEFIRKYSISDVINRVEVEMLPEQSAPWLHEKTLQKLDTLYKCGGKSHTISSAGAKGKRNKVTRSKSLSFSRKNSIIQPFNKSLDVTKRKNSRGKMKGTLLTKKNSIKEESCHLELKLDPSKKNSVDGTNCKAEAVEKECLVQKDSSEEKAHISSNRDPNVLSKNLKTKTISGTLKSMRGRLSTKRMTRKQRKDIRNIEFDGQPVNAPDSDSVILGSDHSSILNKCTADDGLAPAEESLYKLSSVTFEGPLVSRHIAISLFDKLAKKSSSLSTKIIPVVCYLLRNGSNYFKLEVQYKRTLISKLKETSLACQGTVVFELYKELVELIEREYKKSLLGEEYNSELDPPKCISLNDIPVRTKGDITCEVPIEAIVSPERRIVDQITTASCIEPLPPMTEIWKFASQYKQLNQHVVNMELQRVLQQSEPMSQLRALSVIDYLSQNYHNSCKASFLQVVKEISVCDNMDLKKKAQRILSRLSDDNDITPCPSPPRSPHIGETHSSSQNNLVSSHIKRSYDKILPSTVGYQTMVSSDHMDESLLDLGSPCSSNSFNASPASPSRNRFLSFFSPSTSRKSAPLSRRGSADSSDNLLGVHIDSATPV